jgi:RNA polymerase sigma factor (sigma-70 family)
MLASGSAAFSLSVKIEISMRFFCAAKFGVHPTGGTAIWFPLDEYTAPAGGDCGNSAGAPVRDTKPMLSDESLLAGLASGDPEAAAVFVRRFQARVYGLALTMLGDRETAREVAQETFLRAYRHAGAYDARRGRVATWLLTIARNVALDARRPRQDERLDAETIDRLPLSSAEDPANKAAASQDSECLREAIAALPEEQRRALLLAVFRGRTAREISQVEGIPLGTAKTRIRAAMLRLRRALQADARVSRMSSPQQAEDEVADER